MKAIACGFGRVFHSDRHADRRMFALHKKSIPEQKFSFRSLFRVCLTIIYITLHLERKSDLSAIESRAFEYANIPFFRKIYRNTLALPPEVQV
jgi:hypothetical protein